MKLATAAYAGIVAVLVIALFAVANRLDKVPGQINAAEKAVEEAAWKRGYKCGHTIGTKFGWIKALDGAYPYKPGDSPQLARDARLERAYDDWAKGNYRIVRAVLATPAEPAARRAK